MCVICTSGLSWLGDFMYYLSGGCIIIDLSLILRLTLLVSDSINFRRPCKITPDLSMMYTTTATKSALPGPRDSSFRSSNLKLHGPEPQPQNNSFSPCPGFASTDRE